MKHDFKGKKVLVMGLGLHDGGVGTVIFLAKQGAKVTVTDLRSRRELASSLRKIAHLKGIRYVLGRHSRRDFVNADCVVKNPGVRPDSPYLLLARKHRIPVISDVGIFFDECPCRIIGVTGTRGKSTAAYLIWKLLKIKFPRIWLGGNIRKSVLEFLPRLRSHDIVVLELSSFQLHDLEEVGKSPGIAVVTNIMRDHLNWHATMRAYMAAKTVIFKYQHSSDVLFANAHDLKVRRLVRRAPSKVIFPVLPRTLEKIVDLNLGAHYRGAASLAVGVAEHMGVGREAIIHLVRAFKGLEGREEEIAVVRGVHCINDTTATVPEAAIAALVRFRACAGRHCLILIAGGQDKNLQFKEMARVMRGYADEVILLPGTAGEKMKKELRSRKQQSRIVYTEVSSMREAVNAAFEHTKAGDYIVLSPGAASFGIFLNEFDRGQKFIEEVEKYKKCCANPQLEE